MGEAKDHLDAGLLLDLAHGLGSGEERDQALEHLRSCSECEEAFRACMADVEGLRSEPVPESPAPDLQPTPFWVKLANWLRPPQVRIAFGMVVAVAIVILIVRLPGGSPDLPAYWIEREQQFLQLRSSETDTQHEHLWLGIDAYERKNAEEAIGLLEGGIDDGGLNDLRRIYLASALAHENRFDEALVVLQKLHPETLPHPWRSDALWVKYTALVGTEKDLEAESLLEILANDSGVVGELARREMGRLAPNRLR